MIDFYDIIEVETDQGVKFFVFHGEFVVAVCNSLAEADDKVLKHQQEKLKIQLN